MHRLPYLKPPIYGYMLHAYIFNCTSPSTYELLLFNFIHKTIVADFTVTVQRDLVDPKTHCYASSLCG